MLDIKKLKDLYESLPDSALESTIYELEYQISFIRNVLDGRKK